MDELWQRYRAFWTPVLWGVGVFLAGLIVVFVMTDDPEAGQKANTTLVAAIKRKTAPTTSQITTAKANAEIYDGRVKQWAPLLDQRGSEPDALKASVHQALVAAILRGSEPADPARFDGDSAAATAANATFQELEGRILASLRADDPNVSFSRFKADVVSHLSLRANRADVDVGPGAEEFGLASIASVSRAELPWRVVNLALIASIVDVALREGTRSIDTITIQPPEVRGSSTGPEPYVSEWPVSFTVTATPDCVAALVDVVTDPKHPTALGRSTVEQIAKSEGWVRSELKVYSLLVRPEVSLGLESEAGAEAGGN